MNDIETFLTEKGKFRIDLSLNRIEKILAIFNNPENSFECFHIAGTNGKGSTCAILEEILVKDGRKKIGKYTSPHLFSYTERISINKINIKEDELKNLLDEIEAENKKHNIDLTEFEFLTAAAFIYFKRNNVDYVILETGLGGRFDATNIIKKPLISIITSISFDHKERLGNTIEKIALEKAGIFKKDYPCVFLKENAGYKTLLQAAENIGAKVINDTLKVETKDGNAIINGEKTKFNLLGDFQKENLKLALLSLRVLPFEIKKETIFNALSTVHWKFRMENVIYKNNNLLLDGCHNPDGARVLNEYLTKYQKNKKIKFIFGCLKNKEYEKILNTLYNKNYDFCFYEFNYPNALKYKELSRFQSNIKEIKDPIKEIEQGGYDLCVVSGSLYMLGEIFKNHL